MNLDSGTQLSFLSVSKTGPVQVSSPRMAQNVLSRLLNAAPTVSNQSAVYFKAIFPAALTAAERTQGLPISKSTLRPQLLNPTSAITQRPSTRPGDIEQLENLLEFVQRRLSSSAEKSNLETQLEELLAGPNELLVTPDGIASPLYASDRAEATRLFARVKQDHPAETAEALIEAYVLLRANQSDVHTGIAKLFWSQPSLHSETDIYVEGCADGQARAYFRALLALPEDRQREVFAHVNLETFYAAFAERTEEA